MLILGSLDLSGKKLDVRTRVGSDVSFVLTFRTGPPLIPLTSMPPMDLTGQTAMARARRLDNDTEVDFDVEIQTPPTDGQISVALTHDQTADMLGEWRWELSLYDADDSRRTYVTGNLSVLDFGPDEP